VKTKVFISWSGDTSHALALALRDWLPEVLQAVEPWVSTEDIAKGQLWLPAVTAALKEARFGICCLTPENINSPWMAFEAGAMVAHQGAKERVAPVLLGLKTTDAIGPYGSLQHARFTLEEFARLLHSISAVGEHPIDREQVKRSVALHWPPLEQKANAILADVRPADVRRAQRSEQEVLEEVLELVRSHGNMLSQLVVRAGAVSVGNLGSISPLLAAGFAGGTVPNYISSGLFVDPQQAQTPLVLRSAAAAPPAKGSKAPNPADEKK
jgi:hypothetical protein